MHFHFFSTLGKDLTDGICVNTAPRKATGEKGPAIALEPGTYIHSFTELQPHEPLIPAANLPLPYVPVVGVPLSSDHLKTHASRLVLCQVMVVGSAGDSV